MTDHAAIARAAIEAWNTHSASRVLDCYTKTLVYRDPNTSGEIHGADAFERYLTKMFSLWEMHWEVKEIHPFRDVDGAAALWTATLRPRSGDKPVVVDGMDLALVENERLSRNEVYFDRMAIANYMASGGHETGT
jgi:ketosteroid isomerase-like protein